MKRIMFLLSTIVVISLASCGNGIDTKKEMTGTQIVSNYRPDAKFKVTNIDSISNTNFKLVTVSMNNEPQALVNVLCSKSENIRLGQIVQLSEAEYLKTGPAKITVIFIKNL
jgi:uncharacterized lipoprotein YehR (DUF1307 family)